MSTPTPAFQAPAHVAAIAPYKAGKPIEELAREYGIAADDIIKLASNENPLGMPESATRAIAALLAGNGLARYPDASGYELKALLGQRLGVDPSWLTLGNGSNDILEMASLALLGPGASAVYSAHAFAVYKLATQARGARHLQVPAKDYGHDLDAMLAAVDADTRLVFIANPNNPTGTFLPPAKVEAFLTVLAERHGDRVAVVLDEAYNEFLEPELRFDSVEWVRRFPSLIVSRTLSKAHGLASLRIGYAIAQPGLTDLLNRVRQPFNVNLLAQAAAIAAVQDDEFLRRSYEINRSGKQQLSEAFERLGLPYVPSFGNFVLVEVGDAPAINEALLRRGVIVRPVGGDGLPRHLRVSVGLPEENARFIAALTEVLQG